MVKMTEMTDKTAVETEVKAVESKSPAQTAMRYCASSLIKSERFAGKRLILAVLAAENPDKMYTIEEAENAVNEILGKKVN